MSNRILSIDIRKQGLWAVLVRTALKGNRIEAHKFVSFDKAPEEAASPEKRLAWAMETVTSQIPAQGAGCLVSVAASEVSFRNLQVPFKDYRKIRQVLDFELEPTLPVEISALQTDFLIVRQAEQTDLIVAAVETRKLETIQEIFRALDLTPRVITIGSAAAALCVSRLSETGETNFLLLDIDGSNAAACMVVDRKIHMIRAIRTGTAADAAGCADMIAAGIQRMLAAFETLYDGNPELGCIFVSGTDQADNSFAEKLSGTLETEVRFFNLAAETRLYQLSDKDLDIGRQAGCALSLAGIETSGIRPFQFNRSHHVLQKYWAENRNEIISIGVLAFFVFMVLMIQAIIENRHMEDRIAQTDRQITKIFQQAFPDVTRIVDPVQQMEVGISRLKKQNVFTGDDGADIRNVDILKDVSELIPASINVVLTRFVRGQSSVQLAGLTDTFNAVDDIKMQLEKSAFFKQIIISSANMDKSANRVRFRIKADLAEEPL